MNVKQLAAGAKLVGKAFENTGIGGGAVAEAIKNLKAAIAVQKGNTGIAGGELGKKLKALEAAWKVEQGNTGIAGGAVATHLDELKQAFKVQKGNTGIAGGELGKKLKALEEAWKVEQGNTGIGGAVKKKTGWAAEAAQAAQAAPKLDAKKLNDVLASWAFTKGGSIPWTTKKPAGDVLAELTISKPAAGRTGNSVTAFQLAKDPAKVYFRTAGSTMARYFGPVDINHLPK